MDDWSLNICQRPSWSYQKATSCFFPLRHTSGMLLKILISFFIAHLFCLCCRIRDPLPSLPVQMLIIFQMMRFQPKSTGSLRGVPPIFPEAPQLPPPLEHHPLKSPTIFQKWDFRDCIWMNLEYVTWLVPGSCVQLGWYYPYMVNLQIISWIYPDCNCYWQETQHKLKAFKIATWTSWNGTAPGFGCCDWWGQTHVGKWRSFRWQ